MKRLRPTYVHIHLDRLINNYNNLRQILRQQPFLCPMVKANGYGHGDVAVAKALEKEEATYVGVSSVEEGLNLRKHHVSMGILVFGFVGKEACDEMQRHRLTPVVSNFEQLEALSHFQGKVHLKFDTGMHRLGFQRPQVEELVKVLQKNPEIQAEALCTHLHSAEDLSIEGGSSAKQLEDFAQIGSYFPQVVIRHAYNSAAMVSLYKNKKTFIYGARPGLLVYGIDPGENLSLKPLVSPVMEFKSKIVGIQQVKSGDVVSYGGTWSAPKDSVIGIVPAGYGDGVSRSLSNRGEFLVCGQKVPIRGRVCMDYTMVDLTELKRPQSELMNQDVVLIGQQGQQRILVEDVAEASGRVTYEVMTGVSERVPRFYGATGGRASTA